MPIRYTWHHVADFQSSGDLLVDAIEIRSSLADDQTTAELPDDSKPDQ